VKNKEWRPKPQAGGADEMRIVSKHL